ncbi:MAG TPA: hypothetical protein VFB77_04830 [Acidimicrobiales bacterium]|nr:hypothetical protein [Acidimicrobiales bacterium]
MGTPAPPLVEITVGDEPAAWAAIGFDVGSDGTCAVGAVRLRLAGHDGGRGILGWALAADLAEGGDIDGLPTTAADAGPGGPGAHPNGATSMDHVVAITSDLDRTTAALEDRGIVARRTRDAGRGRAQRFFRLGDVILELVGPTEAGSEGPARFWGLAFTVADLDATAALLGEAVGAPKGAVQPGRRIATLRSGDVVSVPVAFMSAAPAAAGGTPPARH